MAFLTYRFHTSGDEMEQRLATSWAASVGSARLGLKSVMLIRCKREWPDRYENMFWLIHR